MSVPLMHPAHPRSELAGPPPLNIFQQIKHERWMQVFHPEKPLLYNYVAEYYLMRARLARFNKLYAVRR